MGPPQPVLDATLFTGGEAEGWIAYPVAQGEGNLMLIVNELLNFDPDSKRYLALDDGAAISVSPDLENIKPTDLGIDRLNPALAADKIITEDWELSVIEVVRGENAWKMVQEVNQFNEPPAEGMEYIAVKVHVRYIGTDENSWTVDSGYFRTTGSAGVLYDSPSVVDPEPSLDADLFPGGEYEGWVVVQAAIDEPGVMLIFSPWYEFGDVNTRYILLEPTS
jgi:hypothetical protein